MIEHTIASSYYEASARQRIHELVDQYSFHEFIGPEQRLISPHLQLFNLPEQFDDGIIIGSAMLAGKPVFIAAQEGRFMGGAIGEVHGAKLLGLIHAAKEKQQDLLLLLDSGGVRLQEANAGEIAIAEIMRAVIEARLAGAKVIVLIGGRSGCFGGAGLISACANTIIMSEYGRLSVSGPEVIETNKGVEEFDSRDRALVWRTMGGKHRHLIGDADIFVSDDISSFRDASIRALSTLQGFDLASLKQQQAKLEARLIDFGDAKDAIDIWQRLGIAHPSAIPSLNDADFSHIAQTITHPSAHSQWHHDKGPLQPLPVPLQNQLTRLFGDNFTVTIHHNHIIGKAQHHHLNYHIIGIANHAFVSIDHAHYLSRQVIDIIENDPKAPIMVFIDSASQNMSKRDELLGLNQYLAQLAKTLIFASLNGHITIGVLYGQSAAGAFIASALASQILVATPQAYPAVMDLPSMARVTKLSLDQLTAMAQQTPVFAPGLDNLFQTGAIDEIWDDSMALAQKLTDLTARLHEQPVIDRRAQLGFERGGRQKTLAICQTIHTIAHGHDRV